MNKILYRPCIRNAMGSLTPIKPHVRAFIAKTGPCNILAEIFCQMKKKEIFFFFFFFFFQMKTKIKK